MTLALGDRPRRGARGRRGGGAPSRSGSTTRSDEAHTAEARGATDPDPASGAKALTEAREAWARLGLPVAAARCALLRGRRLQDTDPEAAAEALDADGDGFEQLGVAHFAGAPATHCAKVGRRAGAGLGQRVRRHPAAATIPAATNAAVASSATRRAGIGKRLATLVASAVSAAPLHASE